MVLRLVIVDLIKHDYKSNDNHNQSNDMMQV